MTDSLPDPWTEVSLLKPLEQYLVRIRMRLDDVFSKLKLAHHASIVCTAACKQTKSDCDLEIASVLFRVVSHNIDMEMRTVGEIIEELGGRTDFTEGKEKFKDLYDKVNGLGKYATKGEATP